jgi:type 2 lantibiotic biosynthesis protein LanM
MSRQRRLSQSSCWYRAATLTERVASVRTAPRQAPDRDFDPGLAERRLRRWRVQPPFPSGLYFARRLAMDGTTEDELERLLGEPSDAVRDRIPALPGWLAELEQAFARPLPGGSVPLPETFREHQMAGFLTAVGPLLEHGRRRLREGVRALSETRPDPPFDPGTVEGLLLPSLLEPLIAMLSRTIVLALNVARLRGLLQGETPEQRFRDFLDRLRRRDTSLALLQKYPVLARQTIVRIDQWVTTSLEFLRRLCADWEAIRTGFTAQADPGVLVALDGAVGDRHRGGRSVLVASFGSGFRVVYKPKSLAVDVHFQELLTWLNHRGDHPAFRTLRVLDRGTYGWVEFVAAQGCASSEEVRRFYRRQGGYLALLYALEATDIHFENLIAAGEHPVLIDLETLFHPRTEEIDERQARQLAASTVTYSVLRIGLLPQRIWSNAESEGIDVSGVGATAGQLSPDGVPSWQAVATDAMRLTRKRVTREGGRNRPTLDRAEVDVLDHVDAIAGGYEAIYRLLRKHRKALLADGGPLARFAEDDVRVILRGSRTYADLLYESFHPDVLRDALDRDRLFDALWQGIEECPYLDRVIAAERDDLQSGDVPLFCARPASRDLWTGSGQRIAEFFADSGMTLVRRRLRRLGPGDLDKQIWFIRASLTTMFTGVDGARRTGVEAAQAAAAPAAEAHATRSRERLLDAARAAGDRLQALALRGADGVSWVGVTPADHRYWAVAPLDAHLYDGLPGVALFLAYLGDITREARYTALAQDALTTVQRQWDENRAFMTSIGAFAGWGGVIYALTHLGSIWDRPELLNEAEDIVRLLPPLIDRDEKLDVFSGVAGCIGGLISLFRCKPSDRVLDAARRCGDRLVARARTSDPGIGWSAGDPPATPATGMPHGAAGIAWALVELAALTGEARFRDGAVAAIAFERSLLSAEDGDRRDTQSDDGSATTAVNAGHGFPTTWCRGAPGIGLARLSSLRHLDDPNIHSEIDLAVRSTLAEGFGVNHSLCHGDVGNLEFLSRAAETLDRPELRRRVNQIATMIVDGIERDGRRCGVPLDVEVPGLMTGLAGIGHGLLRLAEPARVPCVLVLEPPKP